jgi:rhomboid domain-containing protein 1
MHLGFNMMSAFFISSSLERAYGSLLLAHLILLTTLLNSTLYVAVSYALFSCNHPSLLYSHAIGYSGTIFALLILQTDLPDQSQPRSIFGLLSVSAKLYPWALLAVMQIMMPDVSFLGHLGGILVGLAGTRGLLDFSLPHPSYYRHLERHLEIDRSSRSFKGMYVKCPDSFKGVCHSGGNPNGVLGDVKHALWLVIKTSKDIVVTLKVIACGSGNSSGNSSGSSSGGGRSWFARSSSSSSSGGSATAAVAPNLVSATEAARAAALRRSENNRLLGGEGESNV